MIEEKQFVELKTMDEPFVLTLPTDVGVPASQAKVFKPTEVTEITVRRIRIQSKTNSPTRVWIDDVEQKGITSIVFKVDVDNPPTVAIEFRP